MVANHLLLDVSKITFGSEIESVPVPKNDARLKNLSAVPFFVHMPPSMFTISTMWFGPAATAPSGGVHPHDALVSLIPSNC